MSVLCKVPFEGELADADQVGFESQGPGTESLTLENGTTLEITQKVKAVFQLREKKKEDGSPIYICTGEVEIKTTAAGAVQEEV